MQEPSKLQISDLEPIESDNEQEITSEEAKKIVGGIGVLIHKPWPFPLHHPKPPKS
jgi:hypothetical protein